MKKTLGIALFLCLLLTGCGSSASKSASYEAADTEYNGATAGLNSNSSSYDEDYYSANTGGDSYYEETAAADEAAYDEAVVTESYDAGSTSSDEALKDAENQKKSAENKGVINAEMLVYTCNVSIRTDKFQESYDKLKQLINDMSGFIESEDYNESDSSYSSSKTSHMTIRVPSNNYNTMLDSFGDIGTVSSKSSNAQNVSQEYSDTEKALEIYEAELARYIERIKTIKDESALLDLESKITDLQINIAQLKSRKSQIETDVAYSYVYLTLTESSYKEETQESFGGRFVNTIKQSLQSFLDIGEGLLFFIILVLPEVIVIFIIVMVIIKLVKRSKRKKAEKKAKKEAENTGAGTISGADSNNTNVSQANESNENVGNTIDKSV